MSAPVNRVAPLSPDVRPSILIAVAMTALAEFVYLIAFGMVMFPEGDVAAKIVWTATCAVAIGAMVGAAVLVFAPQGRRPGVLIPFMAMAGIGLYCTLLCAWLDARLGFFGGARWSTLFILSGAIPAVVGGVLYAWALNAGAAAAIRRIFGGAS